MYWCANASTVATDTSVKAATSNKQIGRAKKTANEPVDIG